jgi:AraC-like DNA-binding protein
MTELEEIKQLIRDLARRFEAIEVQIAKLSKSPEPRTKQSSLGEPEYLTVQQVAQQLNISEDTVVRRFSGVRGVIDLAEKSAQRDKRPHRMLRIPAGALGRYMQERRVHRSA